MLDAAPAAAPAAAPPPAPVETPPAAAPAAPAATPPPAAAAPAAAPAVPAPDAKVAPAAEAPPAKPVIPDAKPEPVKAAPPAVVIDLKLPEGAKYDPKALDAYKAIFADEKLSPAERAQAVLNLDHQHQQANAKAWNEQVQALRAKDVETLKADKEFGGGKFDSTVAAARSALKQFGGEDLSKLLEESGLDSHPAVVKTFARMRALLAEDSTSSRLPGTKPAAPNTQPPQSWTQRAAARYQKK